MKNLSTLAGCSPKVQSFEVELSGGVLHYVEAGVGKPVLLIHGGYGGWIHWSANIEALSQYCRVLAVDLPGFGHSYDPGRCLMPEEHAQIIEEFLTRLQGSHIALAGFSFGTLVACTLAVRRPDLVSKLVLVNPPGVGPRSPEALALPSRLSTLSKVHGKRTGVEATLRDLMLYHHELINIDLISLLEDSIARTRYVTRSVSQAFDMLDLLRRVTQEIQVLIGERDPFHSNDLQGRKENIEAVLHCGSVHIVPDASHWLQYDQPAYFSDVISELIFDLGCGDAGPGGALTL